MAKSRAKSVFNQFVTLVVYNAMLPMVEFIGDKVWNGQYSKVQLSKVFAEKFLRLPRLPGDRERSRQYSQEVRYDMQNGFFMWSLVMLVKVFVRETKTTYRINGNTTADCVSSLPQGSFIPEVNMAEFTVDTLDEARILFSLLDRGRPRTKSQRVCAMLIGDLGYDSMSKGDVNLLHAGLNLYVCARRYDLTAGQLWNMLRKGGEFYEVAQSIRQLFMQFRRDGEMRYFRKAHIVAVMFAVFRLYPRSGVTFWRNLFSGKKLRPALMIKLRDRLMRLIINNNRTSNKGAEMRSSEEAFRIVAWYYEYIRRNQKKTDAELDKVYEKERPTGYEGRKRS